MRKKIFTRMCLLGLLTVLLSSVLVTFLYFGDFESRLRAEVRTETGYVKAGLELSGGDYLTALSGTQNRITLIAPDGKVIFDSSADPTTMENHLERPEVKKALSAGAGEDVRTSATLSKQTYYYAVKLQSGDVLRLATSTDTVFSAVWGILPWLVGIAVAVALITAMVSRFLTRRIVAPINEIDLDHPADDVVYDELSPLLSKIHKQNGVIAEQMRSLKEKQAEFTFITENMSEGFLVLDVNTDILSYNSSALRLLDAPPLSGDGKESALTLNRSASFIAAVDHALQGHAAEELLQSEGRCCQLMANPVFQEEKVVGAVMVILDVTEQKQRENLRREFTANVSHELKTPLTSISGFAEIMKNHMVKAQDIPRFAGNIYDEAQRLVSLVDDILKISRLDEGDILPEAESLNLLELSRDIARRLEPAAKAGGVTLAVTGDHAVISGVRNIVDEMIFNLCDNAVKYNRKGGLVTVSVQTLLDGARITVQDTGMGIPPGDIDRVFERFYRVDKSHSKEIGGTGLGLSIVKHAAAFLGATVSLESTENVGTTVSVVFPAAQNL